MDLSNLEILFEETRKLTVVSDRTGSPTWARALAEANANLLRRKELIAGHSGIYHLSAAGHPSRYEFARDIVRLMRDASGQTEGWAAIEAVSTDEYPKLPAERPPNPVTSKDKIKRIFGIEMAHWQQQLRSCLENHYRRS